MAWTHKAKHSPSPLARRLLSYLSPDWISVFLDIYRSLRQFVQRERHERMYDILAYDANLELVDPKGQTVVFIQQASVELSDAKYNVSCAGSRTDWA